MANVPKHWNDISWEAKAKENPMYAVMTNAEVAEASAENFDPKHLDLFFAKGARLHDTHMRPLIERAPGPKDSMLIADYGCGMGRLLAPVVSAGYRGIGIDISETMLRHAKELVPGVEAFYLLDQNGECAAPSGEAAVVYSFAVVQHISKFSAFQRAFDVMCRLLKPGGVIGVQVNCEDFTHGDLETPWRTVNEETRSLHFKSGETEPYAIHDQNDWSGVYVGHDNLMRIFDERRVTVTGRYFHTRKKLRGVWYNGVKR